MGRFLTYEVPLFSAFKEFMKGNKPYNKTIVSIVKSEKIIKKLHALVDKIVGGFDNPGTGVMFTIPVDWATGLWPEE